MKSVPITPPKRQINRDSTAICGIKVEPWSNATFLASFRKPRTSAVLFRRAFIKVGPPFEESDTKLRDSPILGRETISPIEREAKDNQRTDDDVRWPFGVPPKGNANFVRV
ncbi:MAG: hypothetical protein JNL10_12545 [Verrucomicrobiales bacterium]|nr:hypothetical protein [Verrucomicrobiales bacterium]